MKEFMCKGLVFIAISVLFLGACKKPEDRKCFKKHGDTKELRVDLPDFTKMTLNKGIVYDLVQDSASYIVIKGGENMLNFITWEIENDNNLKISNNNKCQFLRSYKEKVTVEVHFKKIDFIRSESSEKVTSLNVIKADNLELLIIDGSGQVELNIDTDHFYSDVSHGWGDYVIKGNANYAFLKVRSNGFGDARNLIIRDKLEISNNSVGDLYVNADQIPIFGEIILSGNCYYIGNPTEFHISQTNKGKLIKL